MRVAFLVGSLAAGGLERFVTRISLIAKQQKAFEPVVICLNKRAGVFLEKLEQNNVKVVATNPLWYRSIAGILSLKKVIQSLNVDLVHSQVNYSILQQFLATWLAGKKFTITERSSYNRTGLSLMRRRIQYFFLKMFGVSYSANSKSVAIHLSLMLGVPVNRFLIIPNGIELNERIPSDIESNRSSLGIDKNDIILGYVARMDPPKGHFILLEVLNCLINERRCQLKVVLIGDGSLRKEIEKKVAAFQLEHNVIFIGVVSDVEKWMPIFDVVALLSNREGMPNVVIEAMAAGVPVIGTSVGNIPELLEGEAGVIVDDKDLKGMVDAFENLIYDPQLRKKIGRNAFEKVKCEYSLEATLTILMNYYHSILSSIK